MEVLEMGKSQQSYKHFPKHQHGCWEILLCRSGKGRIFIEDYSWDFIPGSIFILPPFTPHFTQSATGCMDISMFIKDFRPIGGKSLRHFQDDAKNSVEQILEMAWQYSQVSTAYARAAINVMGDLVYQLCVCYYNQTLTQDLRLEGILELMQENIANCDFRLSEALEKTGYHKVYFRRIFKEATGQSPAAYLQMLRVEHAKSLFQQFGTSRTIKDIAAASGYTDALYFSRVFHKLEGISPLAYQKQCMEQSTEKNLTPVLFDTPYPYLNNH